MKDRRPGTPIIDFSEHYSWTPEKEAKHTAGIFAEVSAEQKRLADLHLDWEDSYVRLTRQLAIRKAEIANRLGISSVQIEQEMADDMTHFLRVARWAHKKRISYPTAKIELEKKAAAGQIFEDKVSKYLNRKGSKYDKPMPHPTGMHDSRGIYKKDPLENPKKKSHRPSWKERLVSRSVTRERLDTIERAFNDADKRQR